MPFVRTSICSPRCFPRVPVISTTTWIARTELTAEQRPIEPTNADSHLAFIGSGLRACVSYLTRRPGPVSFIDLDGINAGKPRRRMTTLVGYNNEIEIAKMTLHVPVSKTHPVDAVNLKDSRLGLYDQLDELIRTHGVEKAACGCASDRASSLPASR